MIRQWFAARGQWLWCLVQGHPLRIPGRQFINNRHGRVQEEWTWLQCPCATRNGIVTKKRFARPYDQVIR